MRIDLKKQIHSIYEVNLVNDNLTLKRKSAPMSLKHRSQTWKYTLIVETCENLQVRMAAIKICQTVLPEDKKTLPEVIDTVHRCTV